MDYIDIMEEGKDADEYDDEDDNESFCDDEPFALKRKTRCQDIHKLLKENLTGKRLFLHQSSSFEIEIELHLLHESLFR